MFKRISMSLAMVALFVPFSFGSIRAAEPTLTGKWITDTVLIAAQQKKAKEDELRNNQPLDPLGRGGPRRGGPVRGAGPRARGNNFLPAEPSMRQEPRGNAAAARSEEDEPPMEPAITMDLKADKKKLTGTAIVISPDDLSDEKLKVEEGTVTEKRFQFRTYKKAGSVQVAIVWQGELVSENTIKLTRQTLAGKVIDGVGTVTFTRTK